MIIQLNQREIGDIINQYLTDIGYDIDLTQITLFRIKYSASSTEKIIMEVPILGIKGRINEMGKETQDEEVGEIQIEDLESSNAGTTKIDTTNGVSEGKE